MKFPGTFVWREAARALSRHKLRSALTTIGIMVGVGAVVLVVAVGEAGSARTQAALQDLGDNLVWVEAGSRNAAGVRTGSHGVMSLTLDDAQAIAREVPVLTRISPQIDGNVQLGFGARNWQTRYRGETPEYLDIKRWEIALGSNFTVDDVDRANGKLVLGQIVREQLFGDANPVGQTVRMGGQLYEVTGVLAPRGQSSDGRDQDDWVLLPFTTAQTRLRGKGPRWLDDILCSAESMESVPAAIAQVQALLRERHHIQPGSEDDFNIRRPDELIKAQGETAATMAMLLISVAFVSLLVGGIGIMNVMLASVVQRTREIGVRLAVGATPGAIVRQFLAESVLLSLVGGIGGVIFALLGISFASRILGWPLTLSERAMLVALASSSVVGIASGFYPALRASRLDPIQALRD